MNALLCIVSSFALLYVMWKRLQPASSPASLPSVPWPLQQEYEAYVRQRKLDEQ